MVFVCFGVSSGVLSFGHFDCYCYQNLCPLCLSRALRFCLLQIAFLDTILGCLDPVHYHIPMTNHRCANKSPRQGVTENLHYTFVFDSHLEFRQGWVRLHALYRLDSR